jgi:RNA polymerase sigma-70 factor (ECF subfamily)
MLESSATRPSLLLRVRNVKDAEAWRQFVALYAPLVYGWVRRRGLQDADAADVTQEVFQRVSRAIQTLDYDPRRGSFRGWLFTLTRYTLHNFLARQKQPERGTGDRDVRALLETLPDRSDDEAIWDRDYERHVFTWAVKRVRPQFQESSWRAFWEIAMEGKAGERVARELGMTVGAVYVAKCRVQARLRAEIQSLDVSERGTGLRKDHP